MSGVQARLGCRLQRGFYCILTWDGVMGRRERNGMGRTQFYVYTKIFMMIRGSVQDHYYYLLMSHRLIRSARVAEQESGLPNYTDIRQCSLEVCSSPNLLSDQQRQWIFPNWMEVITFDNLPHVDIKYCQNCEQGPNIKWTWNFKQGMSGQGEERSNKLSKYSHCKIRQYFKIDLWWYAGAWRGPGRAISSTNSR